MEKKGGQGRGRPRMDDDARRERIVDAARKLFQEQGYGRTTTAELVAACHISKQTLYRIFPDKLSLFTAVVEAHRAEMFHFDEAYDDLPLDEAIAKIFLLDIDPAMDRARVNFLRTITMECTRYPELREILQRCGGDKSRAELAAWLDRQRRAGRIELDDTSGGARMLMDLLFGAATFKEAGECGWPESDRRAEYARRCIAVFLRGVEPRGRAARSASPAAPSPDR